MKINYYGGIFSYPRPGSNRHGFKGQGILSPSCLPIPPLRHCFNEHLQKIPILLGTLWSGKRDSNSRPRPWQGRALPTELFPQSGAENETRTRDPDLGKVVLYQLSYFRLSFDGAKVQFFSFMQAFFIKIFFHQTKPLYINYFPSSFLISLSFIKASTGVKVSILVFRMSSLICKSNGSSS